MLILLPIVAATCSTFLALSLPAQHVRRGTVVGVSPWLNLMLAAGGAVGGVAIVFALTFAVLLGRYRLVGDALWNANQWGAGVAPRGTFFLTSKSDPPLLTSTLGRYQCWVRTPDGQVWQAGEGSYGETGENLYATFTCLSEGEHHVRWYATRGKPRLVEAARATIEIDPAQFQKSVAPTDPRQADEDGMPMPR